MLIYFGKCLGAEQSQYMLLLLWDYLHLSIVQSYTMTNIGSNIPETKSCSYYDDRSLFTLLTSLIWILLSPPQYHPHDSASLLVFLPCCAEGLLFHFALEVFPHLTTVSGNLFQSPCPGIASRCLCTYACHVLSALRCTMTLWFLMVAYSLLIAMIAILRYSAECVLWVRLSRYGSVPELTARPTPPTWVISEDSSMAAAGLWGCWASSLVLYALFHLVIYPLAPISFFSKPSYFSTWLNLE